MHTVRIIRHEGMFMSLEAEEGYEADEIIDSLDKIIGTFIER